MSPVSKVEPSTSRGLSTNQLMDHFWGLASVKESDRVKAALALIAIIHKSQTHHESTVTGATWCSDLEYSAKRLIRGLASSRAGARQGYSTTLSELMRCVPVVTPARILALLDEHLNVSRGAKSRETKDAFFGQAFGLMSIVRSGRLDTADEALFSVTTKLATLSRAKSFLCEVCCEAVVDLVANSSMENLQEHVKRAVKTADSAQAVDTFDISMALALEARGVTLETLPGLVTSPVSHPSNFESLSVVMSDVKGSTPQLPCWWRMLITQVTTAAGAEIATLQSFWDTMVEQALFAENRATHERKALGFSIFKELLPGLTGAQVSIVFSEYFMRVFITNLGSKKNYLHVAASLVLTAINEVTATNDDSKLLAMVAQLTGVHGSMRFDSLTRTKTIEHLLAKLTLSGIHDHVDNLITMFLTQGKTADSNDMSELQINSRREVIVEQIVALLRNHRVPKDEAWTMNCVQFLFFHGFCVTNNKAKMKGVFQPLATPLSPPLQKICVDRCFTAIFELATAQPYGVVSEGAAATKTRGMAGMTVDRECRIATIADFVDSLAKKAGVTFVNEMSEDVANLYKELRATVNNIRKVANKREGKASGKASNTIKSQSRAFEVLLLHLALDLYKGTSSDETVSRIQDLLRACSEIFGLNAKAKKKPTKAETDEEEEEVEVEEPNPIEVLVEILMSFLSDSSAAFRSIAAHVFEQVSDSLSLEALSLLLEVLTNEEMDTGVDGGEDEGDEADEHNHDHDHDDDHDHKNDHKEDRPKKIRKLAKASKLENQTDLEGMELEGEADSASDTNDDDAEDSGNDDDDDDDDDDDESAEVDAELREALAKTLGTTGALADDEESGSELSDWDDDRMMQLDGAIAAQFLLSKNSQPQNRKQQEQVTIHFKLRVLDLLDIFVRKQSTNPLIIETIVPMLEAISLASRTKGAEPLLQRLVGIFKNRLCGMRDYPSLEDLDVERVHTVLGAAFTVASNSPIAKEAELASLATLLLVRILIGVKSESTPTTTTTNTDGTFGALNVESVLQLYSTAFEEFMTKKKSRVRPAMFKQFCGRFPEIAVQLTSTFATGLTTGINTFRTGQCVSLLQYLLQQTKPKKSSTGKQGASDTTTFALVIENGALVVNNAVAKGSGVKAKFVRDVLKVVATVLERVGRDALANMPKPVLAFKAAIAKLLESSMAKTSPPVKSTATQISKLLLDVVVNESTTLTTTTTTTPSKKKAKMSKKKTKV